MMMEQGVNPKVVSERLGHASVLITLDTYSHVLPNLQEEAALKFEEGLRTAAESQRARSLDTYVGKMSAIPILKGPRVNPEGLIYI